VKYSKKLFVLDVRSLVCSMKFKRSLGAADRNTEAKDESKPMLKPKNKIFCFKQLFKKSNSSSKWDLFFLEFDFFKVSYLKCSPNMKK
jgi:hypothetical protein